MQVNIQDWTKCFQINTECSFLDLWKIRWTMWEKTQNFILNGHLFSEWCKSDIQSLGFKTEVWPELSYLQFIRQHLPQLFLAQHVETLLQHLPLVTDICCDGLKRQAEVKSPIFNVTANPVQLWVSEFIFGLLLYESNMLLNGWRWWKYPEQGIKLWTLNVWHFSLVCYLDKNENYTICFCVMLIYSWI